MKTKINVMKSLMLFSIGLFLFYSMVYQHIFGEISGITAVLYLLMLVFCAAIAPRKIQMIKDVKWIAGFVFAAAVSGFFFIVEGGMDEFKRLIVRIVCYFIVIVCIYFYVESNQLRLTAILQIIWLCAFILATCTFFIGETAHTYYGGTSIGELNKNVLSCYVTLGLFAGLYLFVVEKWRI